MRRPHSTSMVTRRDARCRRRPRTVSRNAGAYPSLVTRVPFPSAIATLGDHSNGRRSGGTNRKSLVTLRATVGLGTLATHPPRYSDTKYTAAKPASLLKRPAQVRPCTLCCTHSNPSARSVKRNRQELSLWRVRKVLCINSWWLKSFALAHYISTSGVSALSGLVQAD